MKRIILFIFIFYFLIWVEVSFASINLIVSPIKYEFEAEKWDKITKTAKIINKSEEKVILTTWKSNFISNNKSGEPVFVKETEASQKNLNTELASWISFENKTFEIWPSETVEIPFEINVPEDATPGGHYWAVFFTYIWDSNSEWQIKIKADYWVLILVKVDWEIIEEISFWNTWIKIPQVSESYEVFIEKQRKNLDNCVVDFSKNNSDWICFDLKEAISESEDFLNKIKNWFDFSENDNSKNFEIDIEDFNLEFNFPFENTWNVHIKPEWKITISDSDWKILKNIWKEYVLNSDWNIIWEKIVDYIPINQWWWNILPGTTREFSEVFEWVYNKKFDDSWELDFSLINISKYFSDIESEKKSKLNPWESYSQEKAFKELKWEIEIWYINSDWEYISFKNKQNFQVPYTKKIIILNWYFLTLILILFLFFLTILKIIFLIFKRKRKCPNCKKKVKKDMKICPYCMTPLIDEAKKNK